MIYGEKFLNNCTIQEQNKDINSDKLKLAEKTGLALNAVFKKNKFPNVQIIDNINSYAKAINDKFLYKNGNKFGYWAKVKCNSGEEYYSIHKWIRDNIELLKESIEKASKCNVSKIKIDIDHNFGKSMKKPINSFIIIYVTYDL